jgi:hypothetical protein
MGPTNLLVSLADRAGLPVDDDLRKEAQREDVENEIKKAQEDGDDDRVDHLRKQNEHLWNDEDADEPEPNSEVVTSVPEDK